jgi:hypothetical protein
MSLKKIHLTLLLLIVCSLSAFSQSDTVSLTTIIKKTAKLANERPIEKVYLHFDKPYYAVGDTIWFKAYITMDIHQPSTISKVVYVDIMSSKDSIVQSLKLQATGSTALGDIVLSDPLFKQGSYHIRAYTNWMRNFDAAYFFSKTIAVGNADRKLNTSISLAGSTQNTTAKVTARVNFKDLTGKPYVNKRVSWKVMNDEESISKGKGTTDVGGNLNVSFSTNKSNLLNTTFLATEIELVVDEKPVTNKFSLKHAADQPDVQFFPEGGDLVNGLRSRVAFKAVKANGLGADIKGTIIDNTGNVIANLASQHLGMGFFALSPESGKTYKANITFADGSQNVFNLPIAREEGITINADNNDANNLVIKLSANATFFEKNKGKPFYIVAQNGETICFAAQTPLQRVVYSSPIPKTKFPSGVLKLTLFNDRGVALSERVVFIQRNDLLNITMKSAQPVYTIRDKVIMNVTANKDQKPVEANMSVTVIDETKVPFDDVAETTILTNLLLTSDIKGFIEKPNYYFTNVNEKTIADADVLMLTQGYRRFTYKDILANIYPGSKFAPETGITVTGTLRNSTGLPISRGSLNLVIPDRKISVHTTANVSGEFKFDNLVLSDSTKVTINAKNNPNSNGLMVMMNNETFQPVTPNINEAGAIANIDSTLTPYLKNAKQRIESSRMLKEVTITATAIVKKPSHADHAVLTGLSTIPDHVVTSERLVACTFIGMCLQSSIPGVTYDQNQYFVTRAYNQGDKRPMQIYVNGLNVDAGYLQSLSTSEVESVEVFNNDGISGINRMTSTNGVLVINSKIIPRVKMSKEDINALLRSIKTNEATIYPRGYTQPRVFYAPKYEVTKASAIGGDLRTTILWNPTVSTDKTGTTSFQFFNADGKGSYRAIIEGMDRDGNIGRYVYRYKVQ